MIMIVATGLIIFAVGWAQYRNGMFTSCTMLISVLIAGLVAFELFEPIADVMDVSFQNGALAGCEDFIVIMLLFCPTLYGLRWASNYLAPEMLDAHGALQYFGAGAVGLFTGYLLGGFLICATQTLPLDVRFLDFEPRETGEAGYRSIFPGDRVWLALMQHAGDKPFKWKDDPSTDPPQPLTFDRSSTFELRYLRHRRSSEARPPIPYTGEFDQELSKKPR